RLPEADGEAVYRIRRLHLDLWVGAEMRDGEVTDRWGRLLLQRTVDALLRGAPADVVRYDDDAHFVASFLADVLAGRAWSRWVYDEFAPLKDLPPGRIAALLLAARPALLVPVARRLDASRTLEPLLQ